VSTVVWAAVAFFGLVFLATLVGLVFLGLRGWRLLKEVRAGLLAAVEELASSVADVERRLGTVETRSAELQRSIDRLSESLQKARVLLGAAREVTDVVGRVRGVIPQK
jgi:hypothetical protein